MATVEAHHELSRAELAELRGLVEMLRAERAADRAELHALRARVARLEARRARRNDRRDGALLAAIADVMGEQVFCCAELLDAKISPTLAHALARAGLCTAQQLGKHLQRVHGRDLGGLRLERLGVAHGGTHWIVKVIPTL